MVPPAAESGIRGPAGLAGGQSGTQEMTGTLQNLVETMGSAQNGSREVRKPNPVKTKVIKNKGSVGLMSDAGADFSACNS